MIITAWAFLMAVMSGGAVGPGGERNSLLHIGHGHVLLVAAQPSLHRTGAAWDVMIGFGSWGYFAQGRIATFMLSGCMLL